MSHGAKALLDFGGIAIGFTGGQRLRGRRWAGQLAAGVLLGWRPPWKSGEVGAEPPKMNGMDSA